MKQRRRKLLAKPVLLKAAKLYGDGVPVAAIIRNLGLSISNPAMHRLIRQAMQQPSNPSLFPPWLDPTLLDVQTQPKAGYDYIGDFPDGEWVAHD